MNNLKPWKVQKGTFWMEDPSYIELHGATMTYENVTISYIDFTLKTCGKAVAVWMTPRSPLQSRTTLQKDQ